MDRSADFTVDEIRALPESKSFRRVVLAYARARGSAERAPVEVEEALYREAVVLVTAMLNQSGDR